MNCGSDQLKPLTVFLCFPRFTMSFNFSFTGISDSTIVIFRIKSKNGCQLMVLFLGLETNN